MEATMTPILPDPATVLAVAVTLTAPPDFAASAARGRKKVIIFGDVKPNKKLTLERRVMKLKNRSSRKFNVKAKLVTAAVAQERDTSSEHAATIQARSNIEAMVGAQVLMLNGHMLLNSALAGSVSTRTSANKPPWASLVQGHATAPSRFSRSGDMSPPHRRSASLSQPQVLPLT
jgi:hypothetical protein